MSLRTGFKAQSRPRAKALANITSKITGKPRTPDSTSKKDRARFSKLSHQIDRISKFVDLKRGLTLNVGLVKGGTAVNVVPAEAPAVLDVRIAKMKDAAGIDKKLRSLKPFNRHCQNRSRRRD